MGKDFDFFGSTSKVTGAINEEAVRYNRQQPPPKTTLAHASPPKQSSKTYRTGYEAYKNPSYIPELQVDASLWGTGSTKSGNEYGLQQSQHGDYGPGPSQQRGSGVVPKNMMSLEEVEAAMRAQAKKPTPSPAPQQQAHAPPPFSMLQMQQQLPAVTHDTHQQATLPYSHAMAPQNISAQRVAAPPDFGSGQIRIQQRPSQQPSHHKHRSSQILQTEMPTRASPTPQVAPTLQATAPPQILQRGQNMPHQAPDAQASPQPRQILQNPNRHSAQFGPGNNGVPSSAQIQQRGPMAVANGANPTPIIYHPSQIMHLPEEERKLYVEEEAKRAKRNHKIFLLSKGNGLMTPQDKNFITRIQLQQLMTATGNVNESACPKTSIIKSTTKLKIGQDKIPNSHLVILRKHTCSGLVAVKEAWAGDTGAETVICKEWSSKSNEL